MRIGVGVLDDIVAVTVGPAPNKAAVIEGHVTDFVDRATGRPAGTVRGDDGALAVIDNFALLLAS